MSDSGGPGSGSSPLPSATVAVLRQLATALGAYRLYDGAEAAVTTEATERVKAAVRTALATGRCEVAIVGGRFAGGPTDDHLDRLACVLFERRVEHLRVDAVPDAAEFRAFLAAVTRDRDEVARAGGVQALLAAAGVTALQVSEDVPDPSSGQEAPGALWPSTADTAEDDGVAELALALEMLPEQDATVLFDKLRAIAQRLPEDVAARSSFYREVAVLSAALPPTERARFDRLLLDAAPTDLFAERALGHLTDVDLADLIARVARHEGRDPRSLAGQVAGLGHRHANLPRLVLERGLARNRAAGAGPAPGLDPVAAEYGQGLAAQSDELMGIDQAVGDPTPLGVLPPPASAARTSAQQHPLALAFPDDEAAGRAIAATTLVDLVANRPRQEHLDGLCAAIESRLRDDITAARVTEVHLLLDGWRRATERADPPTARQLEEVLLRVLDVEVVVAALEAGAGTALALLRPFAASAVAPLIAALEPYRPDVVRHAARQVLAELGGDHLDAVGSAVGPRSAAARLQVLAALQGVRAPGVAGALGRIAQHRDADLQLQVVEALGEIDPARAAPVIAGVVARSDDRGVMLRGLEVLAAGGAPVARDLLRQLGDRATSPLPGGLRRRARKLSGG